MIPPPKASRVTSICSAALPLSFANRTCPVICPLMDEGLGERDDICATIGAAARNRITTTEDNLSEPNIKGASFAHARATKSNHARWVRYRARKQAADL